MRLYEVRTTEYNGQQEYSFSHLLSAHVLSRTLNALCRFPNNAFCER